MSAFSHDVNLKMAASQISTNINSDVGFTNANGVAGHEIMQAKEIANQVKRLHLENEVAYEDMACLFRIFKK